MFLGFEQESVNNHLNEFLLTLFLQVTMVGVNNSKTNRCFYLRHKLVICSSKCLTL